MNFFYFLFIVSLQNLLAEGLDGGFHPQNSHTHILEKDLDFRKRTIPPRCLVDHAFLVLLDDDMIIIIIINLYTVKLKGLMASAIRYLIKVIMSKS